MRAVLTTTKPSAAHRAIAIDWPLLILTLLIALIGVVNLYSATAPLLLVPQKQGLTDLYVKQITWLVAGGVAAAAVIAIDYRHFERLAYFIYGGGLLLLLSFLCSVATSTGPRGGLKSEAKVASTCSLRST